MQLTFPKPVRLKLAAVALACALCLPAPAPASRSGDYTGSVAGDADATVYFEVSRRHGQDKIRKKAGWTALAATCDGEVSAIDTTFYVPAKVKKIGTFRLDGPDTKDSEIYLEGRIARDGTATGTLRLRTKIRFGRGDVRSCDSGIKRWSAAAE